MSEYSKWRCTRRGQRHSTYTAIFFSNFVTAATRHEFSAARVHGRHEFPRRQASTSFMNVAWMEEFAPQSFTWAHADVWLAITKGQTLCEIKYMMPA